MRVKILKKERLLDDFFKVDGAELIHEKFDGAWSPVVRRLNLERGEAVAVLIYLRDKDSFALIRQFRYAVYEAGEEGWIDEIVAGVLDDESPEECARRECIEEAGYEIDVLEPVATIFVSPGITTEKIHIYIGYCDQSHRKHKGGGLESENEDIRVIEWTREQALKKLMNKEVEDGKTVLALQYFFLKELMSNKK
ncbi:MAG: NUDIX domain-containing protein [Calditrichaeota bacterium]|nr:NUDIX domain-containing protein [Calditrichota bacterium]